MTGQAAAPESHRYRVTWQDERLPVALLPVVIAVMLAAELSLANAGVSADGILTDAASGLAFCLAGLIAWRRRPANRVGPLMLGIGLAWFGGDFLFAPVPLVGPLSFVSQAAARVLFAWLLLAFPSGRLDSRLHRWAVGTIALMAGALALFQLLVLDPASLCACPASPFAIGTDWPLAAQLDNASAAFGIGMTMILVPLVIRRVAVASPAARRSLIPVMLGGLFSLLSVTPDLVAGLSGTALEPFGWLPIVWIALPVGFLLALLDAHMARAAVADLLLDLGAVESPAPAAARATSALRDSGEDGAARSVPWTPGVVVLLAVAAGVFLVSLAYGVSDTQDTTLRILLGAWVAFTYVVAGIIAWWRRPDSRLGPLMIVGGAVTFLDFFVWSDNDLLFAIGVAFDALPPVIFLHVYLAYPSGRLAPGLESAVVAAAYAAAALTIPQLLLGGTTTVFAVTSAPQLADLIQHIQVFALAGLMLAGIGVLLRRRMRGRRPVRSTIGWLVDSFAVGLLMIALLLTAGNLGWTDLQELLRVPTFLVIGVAPIVFLIGLLQAHLVRSSVGDLLVDLSANPGPARLQESVARAIRDPSATLVYRLAGSDAYVDDHGLPAEPVPDHANGRSATPVLRDGEIVAVLLHDSALDDEPQLLAAVSRAVGMTIENSQLQVELAARLADVRASRARIVTAGDAERRRLERDLHDGAQQRLVALSLAIRRAQSRVPSDADTTLTASLDDASELVRDALAELRELARGLHPAVLTEAGLAGALRSLAARSTVPVSIIEVPSERFSPEVEATAYFLVSEALANVAKHAPSSSVEIRVEKRADRLEVEIADDGPGGAVRRPGSGLQGLDDRLAAAGGVLEVRSPSGHGTTVRGDIPLPA